jgi:hypothetical protein
MFPDEVGKFTCSAFSLGLSYCELVSLQTIRTMPFTCSVLLLVTLFFKNDLQTQDWCLSVVPEYRKTVTCLLEKMCMLETLHPDISISAVELGSTAMTDQYTRVDKVSSKSNTPETRPA